MKINVITPEKKLYSGNVKSVYLPGISGEFQILDNHAPIVSILKHGSIKLEDPEADKVGNLKKGDKGLYEISVEGGVIEMNNGEISILAE